MRVVFSFGIEAFWIRAPARGKERFLRSDRKTAGMQSSQRRGPYLKPAGKRQLRVDITG